MTSQYLQIAEHLFEKHGQSMSASELVDRALEQRLFSDTISGLTPHQTMKARLSTEIRRNGPLSIFVRTEPGRFFLRRLLSDPEAAYEAKPIAPAQGHEQVAVFPSTWLDQHGRFQGIVHTWKHLHRSLFKASPITYLDRLTAPPEGWRHGTLPHGTGLPRGPDYQEPIAPLLAANLLTDRGGGANGACCSWQRRTSPWFPRESKALAGVPVPDSGARIVLGQCR